MASILPSTKQFADDTLSTAYDNSYWKMPHLDVPPTSTFLESPSGSHYHSFTSITCCCAFAGGGGGGDANKECLIVAGIIAISVGLFISLGFAFKALIDAQRSNQEETIAHREWLKPELNEADKQIYQNAKIVWGAMRNEQLCQGGSLLVVTGGAALLITALVLLLLEAQMPYYPFLLGGIGTVGTGIMLLVLNMKARSRLELKRACEAIDQQVYHPLPSAPPEDPVYT